MRKVIFYWALITAILCAGFVIYFRTRPPDELVMANSLGFQVVVSLLFVGGPSLFVLFLVLFFGALVFRRRRHDSWRCSAYSLVFSSRWRGRFPFGPLRSPAMDLLLHRLYPSRSYP